MVNTSSFGNLMIQFHLPLLLNIYPTEYLHQMLVNPWRFPMEFTTSPLVLAPVQLLSHPWSCKHQIDPGMKGVSWGYHGTRTTYSTYFLVHPVTCLWNIPSVIFKQILTGVHIQESRLHPLVIEETSVPKCFFPSQSSGTEWTGWAPVKERPRERLAMSSRQWLVCRNLGVGWLDTLFFVLHFCNIWLNFGHNRYLIMPNSCRLSLQKFERIIFTKENGITKQSWDVIGENQQK